MWLPKQLEVSREGVQLVDTPSTDWLIFKHCFVGQREAHVLGAVSFSALFLLPNFGEGKVQRVTTLVLSHSAPQSLQSSKISAMSFCLHVPVLEREKEEHEKKDKD